MHGNIFDIQRFCVHDGPGIRTTVFFKGCNLRCRWCHNPESMSALQQIEFISNNCIGCGNCFNVCLNSCHSISDGKHQIDRDKCIYCGECVKDCYAKALQFVKKEMTPEEIIKVVLLDKIFYKEKGGITVSGGEPLLQPDFAEELLCLAKQNGLNTAVDTAGCVPFESIKKVLPYTDLFLYDIKCMDSDTHKKYTNVQNEIILKNLEKLNSENVCIWVRIPVVIPFNSNDANMSDTASFISRLSCVEKVELLSYHKLGGGKYENLGMVYNEDFLETPSKTEMQKYEGIFKSHNINCIVR